MPSIHNLQLPSFKIDFSNSNFKDVRNIIFGAVLSPNPNVLKCIFNGMKARRNVPNTLPSEWGLKTNLSAGPGRLRKQTGDTTGIGTVTYLRNNTNVFYDWCCF